MKKALSVAIAAALAMSLCACGSSSSDSSPAPAPVPEVTENSSESESEPEPIVEIKAFESVKYEGSGDDVIEIAPPHDRPWMLEITGNSSSRHFSVKGYDEAMEYTELFVNTTDPYTGFVLDPSLSTVTLEISAEGDWSIAVHDLYATVPSIGKGESISGFGDAVYEITSYGNIAEIKGNSDARHFSVKTFGNNYDELLVNTVDPYNGTVMLKGDPFLLIIDSDSDWFITF